MMCMSLSSARIIYFTASGSALRNETPPQESCRLPGSMLLPHVTAS
jgi:hypothetical protein